MAKIFGTSIIENHFAFGNSNKIYQLQINLMIITMSYVNLNVHCVWSTKNRMPFLDSRALRFKVWTHILNNARAKGIFIDTINGYSDHCHCLISLRGYQTVQDIMQYIKGESSFWINIEGLTPEKFSWQEEYYAVSVSQKYLQSVRQYIRNQEEYHSDKSFQEELRELNFDD